MVLETYSQMEKSGEVKQVGYAQTTKKIIDTKGEKERRKKGNVFFFFNFFKHDAMYIFPYKSFNLDSSLNFLVRMKQKHSSFS